MKLYIVFLIALPLFLGACGNNSSGTPSSQENTIPPLTFGINMEWENLGYYSVTGGELLRDRSFRMNHTTFLDLFGTVKAPLWNPYENGGTVTFYSAGGDSPASEKSYNGYADLSRTGDSTFIPKFTGISQLLISDIKSGEKYKLTFSSYGVSGSFSIVSYLFKVTPGFAAVSDTDVSTSDNSLWKRHVITFTATEDCATAFVAIYLRHPNADSSLHKVYIDEVRLSKLSTEPSVKTSVKTALTDLGVKSVRWPGGTLVDFFDWKSSVGTNMTRGEIQAAAEYQTPAFGMHEFLNLCEELNMEPVIQVNFLNGTAEAEELVEYILGADTTTQGTIRKANGRTAPWNVKYFEIGNEPALSYKGSESAANTHLGYITLAKPVTITVKNKAISLGKTIKVSGIIEPSFQLADWFTAAAAAIFAGSSDEKIAVVNALYYWNSAVLGTGGLASDIDFLDGHFYGFQEYDSALTVQQRYEIALASGATLEKSMIDKIRPLSGTPLMLTEFHLMPADKDTKVFQVDNMRDFQSGLGIADILLAAIRLNSEGAHLYSFAHPYFGAVQNIDTGRLRPAGLALKMLSPLAGEEKINVSSSDTDVITIASGSGNVPSGLTYPAVFIIAAKNSSTGKAKIFLFNRSFSSAKTVTLTFDTDINGNADIFTLNNVDLTANNESSVNVSITQTTGSFGSPFTVTIPAHSLMRIEMK